MTHYPIIRQTGDDEYECPCCGAVNQFEDCDTPSMAPGIVPDGDTLRCTVCGSLVR